MQNNPSATNSWLRPCLKCGKETFSDLLDREGICDYCREMRSMKARISRASKKEKGRK